MKNQKRHTASRRRNTVADNCLTKIEANYCGYYLKDGSFVVVAGGTGYTEHKCSLLASALQRNYTHTLTVIDGERYAETEKTYDTRKGARK